MRASFKARRQAERRECSIKAQAHSYDGSPSIDCIITDFSPTGAKIIFPADREPPSAFDLFVPSRGDTRHALVRWKTPESVGVEFIQGRGSTDDQRMSDALVRLSKLEGEFRAFKADTTLLRAVGHAAVEASRDDVMPPASTTPVDRTTLIERLDAIEARSGQDRTEWEVVADRLAALEMRPGAPTNDDTLEARVTTLEARGDEILHALKQTLAVLAELRDATAPLAKAG